VVGAVVLLRSPPRQVLRWAALVVPPTVVAAVAVDAYAGTSVPTNGFSAAFNFGEPAVLTQDWIRANVALATVAGLALLGVWVAVALLAAPRWRAVVLAGLAAVSMAATAQLTVTISRASTPLVRANLLPDPVPGRQIAVSKDLSWEVWVTQAYQVSWTQLEFFSPASQPPPGGAALVEVPWAGNSARASWPQAPRGWHVSGASQSGGWVVWTSQSAR
jgi:hypothetical protein